MRRYELINWFIEQYGYTRYLEIGIDNPSKCFDQVVCAHKTGVDPNVGRTNPPHHYRMTSDAFFKSVPGSFDIVFVDGLHLRDQVLRDVDNALAVLAPNGTILMHDCWPPNERAAGATRHPAQPWYGTVWQAWAQLRATRRDLTMHVFADDCGIGIVRRGTQVLYTGPYQTFADFQAHHADILQIIGPGNLTGIYKGKH
jgi:hypothetical protein